MIVDGERLKKWIEENKVHMKFQAGSVSFPGGYIEGIRVDDVSDFWEALKKCEVDIQPPARIEAAIRYLTPKLSDFVQDASTYVPPPRVFSGKEVADFGLWVLKKKQPTWKNKDFGLKPETPNQKGG